MCLHTEAWLTCVESTHSWTHNLLHDEAHSPCTESTTSEHAFWHRLKAYSAVVQPTTSWTCSEIKTYKRLKRMLILVSMQILKGQKKCLTCHSRTLWLMTTSWWRTVNSDPILLCTLSTCNCLYKYLLELMTCCISILCNQYKIWRKDIQPGAKCFILCFVC